MEKKRSSKSIILFNFIPIIIVHICFLPFWLSDNISFTTRLTSIEMIFSIILLPLYLIIFNSIYSVRSKQFNFLPNIAVMLAATILSNCLYYFNWGISTENLLSPDGATVYLFQSGVKINFISIVIFGIIWQMILRFIKHLTPEVKEVYKVNGISCRNKK